MKFFKKIILGAGVFLMVAILGVVYFFFTAKNKPASVKVGDNIFEAEIADTVASRAKGLSYRDSLKENGGMLFDFGGEIEPSFWMMGMKFPIDIIWIRAGKVIGVEKNVQAAGKDTPEAALRAYKPSTPVDMVLEINAGLSDKLGIKIGNGVALN